MQGENESLAVSEPYPIQVRFSDTDRLGHVNNAVIATYAEVGRLAFLRQLGLTSQTLILARSAIDFVRQVHLGNDVRVVTRVARIGNTSFTLDQTITADGEVAAEVEAVLVCFDYQAQRPVPVPEAFRRALSGGATAAGR